MTGTGTLTSFGTSTKSVVLAEEEDKIRIEFTTAAIVKKGQPVKLTATGTITPWAKTDLQHLCVGYCDADAASGALVTVVCRGYAIIFGISAAAVVCGPGTYNGYDSTNADTNQYSAIGYSIYGAATDVTDAIAWVIDPASAANQLMRVLIKN